MATIKPYKIAVPDSALETLHTKLTHATFPNPVDFSDNWDYGSPLTDVKRLAERWRDGYDWRKHEKKLNDELPQFTTRVPVDGFGELGIHFVHKRGKRENSIPLLFVHGCKRTSHHVSNVTSDDRYQGRGAFWRSSRSCHYSQTQRAMRRLSTLWRLRCPITGFPMRSLKARSRSDIIPQPFIKLCSISATTNMVSRQLRVQIDEIV